MKLWIDDFREPPDDSWVWAKTVLDAFLEWEYNIVEEVAFDYDLGHGETSLIFAKFIEALAHDGLIDPIKWSVHSDNPAGRKNLIAALESADRYWKEHGF